MRLIISPLFAAVLAACGTLTQTPPQIISLDLTHGPPLVHMTIGNGAVVRAIFDTGSDSSVLNIDYARASNLAEQGPDFVVSPLGGPHIEGFHTTVRSATIEGVAAPAFEATAVPLDLGTPVAVLSPNIFSGKWLTLDFGASRLLIADRGAHPPAGASSTYDADGRLPTISVVIAGHTLSGHLDTGSEGALSLPFAMASSLPLEAPPRKTARGQSAGAEFDIYSAQLHGDARVGALLLHNPEIEFLDVEGAPINVGMGVLRRMQIVLDPERKLVWTRPRAD